MRSKILAGVVLVLVFAAGVLGGVFLERHHSVHNSHTIPVAALRPSVEQEHLAAMTELRDALELSEQQMSRIHEILSKRREVVQLMWEQLRPEVQSAMRQVHLEIAEQLSQEQRERFHSWLQARREKHEAPQSLPPPPHHP